MVAVAAAMARQLQGHSQSTRLQGSGRFGLDSKVEEVGTAVAGFAAGGHSGVRGGRGVVEDRAEAAFGCRIEAKVELQQALRLSGSLRHTPRPSRLTRPGAPGLRRMHTGSRAQAGLRSTRA